MVVSFHSHSGEFCHHASGTLESVIQSAIEKEFVMYGLSEHMPRYRACDLYPEEVSKSISLSDLSTVFLEFLKTAKILKKKYASSIDIKIGMETEWIYSESLTQIQSLLSSCHEIEYIVGSVHHIEGIPIDYNEALVSQAENHLAMKSNESGTELLFQAYFNAQYDMLLNLKPDIIGHFDLIRLFRPNYPLSETVWSLIKRNISFIKEYDGLVELNPRSLKKGLQDIYPFEDILREMIAFKIKFTLGDDSHSPLEVGLHYDSLRQILQDNNISQVYIPGSSNPISILNKWINL